MTLSQIIAAWANGLTALPPEIEAATRLHVMDTVGVALGALPLETSRAVLDHVAEAGGARQATAFGLPEQVPVAEAAFVNGVLAHSLDYDDTHLPSIVHPSASVVPAALAAAEFTHATPEQTLAAIAAGLEVTVRLGMAGSDATKRQSMYFERGQHATSICGAIGSAVAAAMLLEADIADAIGIAVSMGAGVIEGNRTGGTVKRIHCGIAARSGVTAAQLARRGITGPPTALEGRFGFFQAWLDGVFDATALEQIGQNWEIPRIFFKPYPANHFTHAGIDAAIALRARGIGPEDIDAITLGVAAPTVRTIGEPLDAKRAPATGYLAQFSGPFTVAAALCGGGGLGVSLDDFTDERAKDPARLALAAKVTVVADDECAAIYPEQFPAVLTARLRDGSEVVERVLANRGGPARPLTDDEVETKFQQNAARAFDHERVATMARALRDVAAFTEVNELLDLFSPDP